MHRLVEGPNMNSYVRRAQAPTHYLSRPLCVKGCGAFLCQGLRRRCGEERSDEELGAWRAWALGLALAREWLFRRAGDSGCEPVTLDAESFPVCPPGSLAVLFGAGRPASLIMRL